MKAITTCAPLLLILAIGCDDNNEAVELDNETTQTRWAPSEGPLKTVENATVSRAAHIVKSHRAITQMVDQAVLNPYIDADSLDELLPNCTIEKSTVLDDTDSACANMPAKTYEMDLVECDFGDGEIYSGSVLVSAEILDHLDVLSPNPSGPGIDLLPVHMQQNTSWFLDIQLDSADGTTIDACGVASTGRRSNSSSVIMNVSHPSNTDSAGNPTGATYEATSTNQNRGTKFSTVQSELTLMSTNAPEFEVENVRIRATYKATSLLPQFGQARYSGQENGRIQFNSQVYAPNMVAADTPFHGVSLVEVPKL